MKNIIRHSLNLGGTNLQSESLREAYGDELRKLGHKRKDIVVLDADLSSSTKTAVFGKEFPDRFFNMGIS